MVLLLVVVCYLNPKVQFSWKVVVKLQGHRFDGVLHPHAEELGDHGDGLLQVREVRRHEGPNFGVEHLCFGMGLKKEEQEDMKEREGVKEASKRGRNSGVRAEARISRSWGS